MSQNYNENNYYSWDGGQEEVFDPQYAQNVRGRSRLHT